MLEEKSRIISNKMFQRLGEKTQVLHPRNGREETVQNRLTHSFKVSAIAKITAKEIGLEEFNIDDIYKNSALENVCLLHDIGHPPFGHEGARYLDSFFKEAGLIEGFSDNNNNFIVIDKNQIEISDYTKASLIKYPDRLYKYQEADLHRILEKAIDRDLENFHGIVNINKRPNKTLLCKIMDEADRNSYVCSDLADYFSLGMGHAFIVDDILAAGEFKLNSILAFLYALRGAIRATNKTLIKKLFGDLEVIFAKNYYLGEDLELIAKNKELLRFRELLYKKETELFIYDKGLLEQRAKNIELLEIYTNKIFEIAFEKDGVFPSKTYTNFFLEAKNRSADKIEKMRILRDMIAETTDWFIFKKAKN